MKGNEYIKEKRKSCHLSIRGFAMLCDIAPRMVSYYEKGESPLTSLPVSKAVRYFTVLDCDIEEFFFSFYPFKTELDGMLLSWTEAHPRCYTISVLKKKYYLRLAKIKERSCISVEEYNMLAQKYKNLFERVLINKSVLSDKEYDQYIIPFNRLIRKTLSVFSNDSGTIAGQIEDAIYNTEYSFSDIGRFCGVTRLHLRGCLDGTYNMENIRIIFALKLCYVLGLDFNYIFKKNN